MNIKEMIQAEIDKTQAKFAKAGLQPFPIPFNLVNGLKKVGTIATAYYKGHIDFNLNYFQFPEDIPFAQLVAHEVAHLYQFKYFPEARQGHGREFRMLMKYLGFSGNAKVAVAGQAKAYNAMVASAAPQRKPKLKTRHVYVTVNSNREVFLTVQQHKKQQETLAVYGHSRFTSKGEPLSYKNEVRKFK